MIECLLFQICFLELFVKVAVSSKTRPDLSVIHECKTLLRLVTPDEFEKTLLPAIMKAMLRNPEIILQCIGCVIFYLSFDLSKFTMDIGKNFAGRL